MNNGPSARRLVLLALSLLSGCAASAGPGGGSGSGLSSASLTRTTVAAIGEAGDSAAFLVGRFAGQQGDLDIAASAFLQVVSDQPDNVEARQQAFLACLLAGRKEAARMAEGQSANPIAVMLLGDVAAARGAWTEAERQYATLPNQGMTQILKPLLIAWAQAGSGRTDQALASLKPYESGDRLRAVFLFHAALIADLGQRDPEAGRLYAAAGAEFATPNLAITRAQASWLARHGDVAGANRLLDALLATSPDFAIAMSGLKAHVADRSAPSATDGMAEAYVAMAAALQGQEALEPAALLLRLALQLHPDFSGAKLLSAEIDEQGHRPRAALATLQSVPDGDPLAPLAALRQASLLQRLGEPDAALAVLDRVAAAAPTRPDPLLMRGAILRNQHRYSEAVAAYTAALALVPKPGRNQWGIFFERGIAFERAGDWPRAQADLEHALELFPEQPSVLNYLGYSWTERGHDLARARQMIERAQAQRPNDGAIVDSLGWVLLRQGDAAGAVRNLEHAVELEPEDATINGHLGDAYSASGRKIEANFQWHRALTLNPDPEEQTRIAARLRETGEAAPPVGATATGQSRP